MKKPIAASELILNEDKSIYHLKLKPGEIAKNIITVGDQNRVDLVAKNFDKILVEKSNREFKTITGEIGNKLISVISTGIGTDNIDIVFNEIDALFNIDFETRLVKEKITNLIFYRIGTSGTIQKNIAIDSFVVSEFAIGFDSLFRFYKQNLNKKNAKFFNQVSEFFNDKLPNLKNAFYFESGDENLTTAFETFCKKGITITMPGFYAPQGRKIRTKNTVENFTEKLSKANFGKQKQFTNIEMETAGIYFLAKHLNHKAVSLNAILANRITGEFSKQPQKTIELLIQKSLEKITSI